MMALNVLHLLVLILVDFLIFQPSKSAHINTIINVSSKVGRDNESCLTNFSQPCRTLGYVLERLENFTLVQISNGLYNLDENYNITNKQNISFIGESSEVLIKCNRSKECGLWFQRCEEIGFDNLTFDGCGHLQSTSPFEANGSVYQFYVGISFTYCKNLEIYGCTFKNSRGIAMVLYDTGGIVNVIGSHFLNNSDFNISLDLGTNIMKSGGGIFIHLTQYGSHPLYGNNNSNYTFKHSRFQENHADKVNRSNDIPIPFGCGAGLTAYICGSAQKNSLIIDSCHFISNKALFGGGAFVEFHNEAQGNSVSFINNTFLKNKAIDGGGAVRTGNNIIEKGTTTLKENTIKYVDNRFYQNTATLGGALSHYGWTYHQRSVNDDRKISLKKCHFMGNIATMGSAIAVALNDKNRWMVMGNEMPYALELTNCTVEDNFVYNDHVKEKVIGMGAVYTSRVPCILKGANTFYNNSNTALLLDNAPLKVYDKTLFKENKGYKGGALAMYGLTRLIMTKDSHLLFKNNTAMDRGGAIYIRTPGPDVAPFHTTQLRRHDCFIVYEDNGKIINVDKIQVGEWHAKLDFINNSARFLYGNAIYATTLQSCYLKHEQSGNNTAFQWKGVISYNGSTEEEISTDPVDILFNLTEWSSLAPYEKFNASIRLLDEKHNTLAGVVKINVRGVEKNSSHDQEPLPGLVPHLSLFLVLPFKSDNKIISFVPGLRVKGIVGQNFTFEISTSNGQVVSVISDEMNLGNCLDGFDQTKSALAQGKCVCMMDNETYHEGVSKCSDDGRSVYLKTGYWGGKLNNWGNFVTYPCPPGYCKFNESKFDFLYKKTTICDHKRSSDSTLCGTCKKGFSLTLGSEECIEDSTCKGKVYTAYWGVPVFLVVVPFIVILLLRLNVDIFTSYLNAWLYFYQVLPYVVQDSELLDDGMQVILDFTSWRLPGTHIPCFLKGLDNIDKMLFNYLFPLYVLMVLLLISWFARCGCCFRVFTRCCGFLQHVNIYHAISTILVLCYTQLTLISFHVCRWVPIEGDTDVLFIQGSIYNSSDGSHNVPTLYYLCLCIAILVILCFVILLPLALIFRSPLGRKIRFMRNFNGLFDIFQNCFSDRYRWFSAYYFICRIGLLFFTAVLSTPGPRKRCLMEILVILSLAIFAFCKPYKQNEDSNLKWLNIVDTLILTDLCIITAMSSARNSEASDGTRKSLKYGMRFLSWLPMVYLFGLIVLAIRQYCSSTNARREEYEDLDDPSSHTESSS